MGNSSLETDVIVVGGGLVGLTQSLLLAQASVSVICIDREISKNYEASPFSQRTTAISYGSHLILKQAGIWDDLKPHACAIKDIRVIDGNSPILLNFDLNENQEAEDAEGFGWVIQNFVLRRILLAALKKQKSATHIEGGFIKDFNYTKNGIKAITQENQIINGKLVIGADGRQSFTRQWASIDVDSHDYQQRAIISIIEHENPHHNIAVEHFRKDGPFAILPMIDNNKNRHQSSIVWTEDKTTKRSIMDFDEDTYLTALNYRFPKEYGRIFNTSERISYPLGYIHAHEYIRPRLALIGDAAHGIHPIAGQGLNLGLRDVRDLTDLIVSAHNSNQDIFSDYILNQYQRKRRADNLSMAGATHFTNKLFSNKNAALRMTRKIGLKFINNFKPARNIILKNTMGSR